MFSLTACLPEPEEAFDAASNIIFQMYDEQLLNVGERFFLLHEPIEGNERALENKELYDSLKSLKEKEEVCIVYFVDKNVILFSKGAYFQSVSGIAKTRNSPELKRDWGIGFDGGMTYTQIDDNTYKFFDGL